MKTGRWIATVLVLAMLLGLCGCGAQGPYRVRVEDENGNPVPGLAVQLCKDSCMMAVTDEQGIVTFDAPPDDYKVAFVRLPEGYAADREEFLFETGSREMTIVLKTVQ